MVCLVVGESRAGHWAGRGRSINACILNLELQSFVVVENRVIVVVVESRRI